jgi:hypothetical protein
MSPLVPTVLFSATNHASFYYLPKQAVCFGAPLRSLLLLLIQRSEQASAMLASAVHGHERGITTKYWFGAVTAVFDGCLAYLLDAVMFLAFSYSSCFHFAVSNCIGSALPPQSSTDVFWSYQKKIHIEAIALRRNWTYDA